MRPMTAREALRIHSTPTSVFDADMYDHARRLLDALVELRESELDYRNGALSFIALRAWGTVERKLAALERGEEPQA